MVVGCPLNASDSSCVPTRRHAVARSSACVVVVVALPARASVAGSVIPAVVLGLWVVVAGLRR